MGLENKQNYTMQIKRTNVVHVKDHDQGSQLVEHRQSLDGEILMQMSHGYRDISCVVLCIDSPTGCQGK